MLKERKNEEGWEDDEDYSPTSYKRSHNESDEEYQERMEDYESYLEYNNDWLLDGIPKIGGERVKILPSHHFFNICAWVLFAALVLFQTVP